MEAIEKAKRLEKLAQQRMLDKQQVQAQTRLELRARHPDIAKLVDDLREVFGPEVKVTKLERGENGPTGKQASDSIVPLSEKLDMRSRFSG